MPGSGRSSRSWAERATALRWVLVTALVLGGVFVPGSTSTAAVASPYRIDLRVLVIDDNSPWVDAIEWQLLVEGVPYTAIALGDPGRPLITDAFLSAGDRAFFQGVVGPDYLMTGLSAAERTDLREFEAKFGVREVGGFNWANPGNGLNYAGFVGDLNGVTAAVTTAGRSNGFGYLDGPVPFGPGSYSFLAEPLAAAALPARSSFTTLVGAPLPNGATGSLLGVYTNAGVEQLVITAAFSFALSQYKLLAHGIVSWVTRGVHLGYNRNNFTFHVDDAFASVATWNSEFNCTPGEDCPRNPDGSSIYPETSVRMTPADVTYAVQWQQANNYRLTMAFNSFYADAATDPLTQAFQANGSAFTWLNHGSEHLFQGCTQNFTVVPWQCTVDANGQVVWMSQQAVFDEINNNIVKGQQLGLSFDPTEYLSGEHSGLFFLPQQPVDNPNFAAALTQAGIRFIASDASRDNASRQVGSATTVPRHPTALYYNTATRAEAVDEYNWLYTTRANGGSGYCEDNPATATCIAPLDPATGFTNYIVPNDVAYNLSFILANDPRPFYAHTSNMTSERIMYPLLESILGRYRAAFTDATPLLNLTLTQATTALDLQTRWASSGVGSVSASVTNGVISIVNPTGLAVPITAPAGTTVVGATLQPYGGEISGWVTGGSIAGTIPASQLTITGATALIVGSPASVQVTATGSPAPTVSVVGQLPAGLTVTTGPGSATITGAPATGSTGSYPLTISSVDATATQTEQIVLTVADRPFFTSAAAATAVAGRSFSFAVTTGGSPAATIIPSGTLPSGVTFTGGANGAALLSGTPLSSAAGRTYPITFTATNSTGSVTQAFVLTVGAVPAFTGGSSLSVTELTPFRWTIRTTGSPAPTITLSGTLPTGVGFVNNGNGTARISGTAARGTSRTYTFTLTATNVHGSVSRIYTLVVRPLA